MKTMKKKKNTITPLYPEIIKYIQKQCTLAFKRKDYDERLMLAHLYWSFLEEYNENEKK